MPILAVDGVFIAYVAIIFDALRQLQIQRERSFQIGKGLQHQGDAVKAFRFALGKFLFSNHKRAFLSCATNTWVEVFERRPQSACAGEGVIQVSQSAQK